MISIDTVYQRVLALANKEQRGYITPLEFNLLANQAQMAIFEQYFYDLSQEKRKEDIGGGNDISSFSDMPELIKNKLAPFTSIVNAANGNTFPVNYRTGRIFVGSDIVKPEAKKVSFNESLYYLNSTFHRKALKENPIYRESQISGKDIDAINHNGIVGSASDVRVEIIRKPHKVEWGYDVIAEKALYNASHSTDFQLHESEEVELVYKILTLAGITIKKDDLTRGGIVMDSSKAQQEKI
jgi:hypothetical protein